MAFSTLTTLSYKDPLQISWGNQVKENLDTIWGKLLEKTESSWQTITLGTAITWSTLVTAGTVPVALTCFFRKDGSDTQIATAYYFSEGQPPVSFTGGHSAVVKSTGDVVFNTASNYMPCIWDTNTNAMFFWFQLWHRLKL